MSDDVIDIFILIIAYTQQRNMKLTAKLVFDFVTNPQRTKSIFGSFIVIIINTDRFEMLTSVKLDQTGRCGWKVRF